MTPTDTNAFLQWEVFVTPGIPIVTRDKPVWALWTSARAVKPLNPEVVA